MPRAPLALMARGFTSPSYQSNDPEIKQPTTSPLLPHVDTEQQQTGEHVKPRPPSAPQRWPTSPPPLYTPDLRTKQQQTGRDVIPHTPGAQRQPNSHPPSYDSHDPEIKQPRARQGFLRRADTPAQPRPNSLPPGFWSPEPTSHVYQRTVNRRNRLAGTLPYYSRAPRNMLNHPQGRYRQRLAEQTVNQGGLRRVQRNGLRLRQSHQN